jgi:lysophospholipase L1-like esterase
VKPLLSLLALLLVTSLARADFELKDGDRVVFLGSTLVEREQRYGWWELALTTRFAGKKIIFRNLGWSGDTVFGESHVGYAYTRSGTASVAGGFEHLVKHTLSLKPTVLIIGYGTNESFEGEKGLEKFTKGLNTLLDAIAPSKAKVVLLSPMQQGNMGKPLPDPTKNNKNLRLYADAIKGVAEKRKSTFIDLYELIGDPAKEKGATENGIHLTSHGYQWSSKAIEKGLGISTPAWRVEIDWKEKTTSAKGAKLGWEKGENEFRLTDDRLPHGDRIFVIKGLPERIGYGLSHDDKKVGQWAATGSPAAFAKGVEVSAGPAFEQREKLRQAIIDKNELYFHRWRPQNETYLFGFRKHEQGKNAIEIPKFDPLIEKKEKEIVELSKPVPYTLWLRGSDR